MNLFFVLVELSSYLFAIYLLVNKAKMAVIYLPLLFFANNLIEPTLSASVYYSTITLLLLASAARSGMFFRNNLFAVLLFFYFLLLLLRVTDLVAIRAQVFSVLWLFFSVPLITEVYQTEEEGVVFRELSHCATLILGLFIVNVLFCTAYRYAPNPMYGITSGVLYGNMYGAGFNVLALAVFVVSLRLIEGKHTVLLSGLLMISLTLVLLSLRRSVMLLSVLGSVVALIAFFAQKQARQLVIFGGLALLLGYGIYSATDFKDEFQTRYEVRNLDERAVSEEKRLFEYELIYKDLFEYEAYSPWVGYEPLNSAGNYGRGVFGERTLHADIPSIIHSAGLIGLALYLLMAFAAFAQALRASVTGLDKLIVFFCFVLFVVYTLTGRFTEGAAMTLLYLVLALPQAGRKLAYEHVVPATPLPQQNEINLTGILGSE